MCLDDVIKTFKEFRILAYLNDSINLSSFSNIYVWIRLIKNFIANIFWLLLQIVEKFGQIWELKNMDQFAKFEGPICNFEGPIYNFKNLMNQFTLFKT